MESARQTSEPRETRDHGPIRRNAPPCAGNMKSRCLELELPYARGQDDRCQALWTSGAHRPCAFLVSGCEPYARAIRTSGPTGLFQIPESHGAHAGRSEVGDGHPDAPRPTGLATDLFQSNSLWSPEGGCVRGLSSRPE